MEKPDLRKTALYEKHLELGAKMVDYSGFEMPVSYDGLKVEHASVREKVGMFDVSHMGEFTIKGEDALEVLQNITTNDVSKLNDGKIQYSCIPNGKGGIVDDLLIYRMSEGNYMLVVNASNMDKDWDFISHKIKDGEYNVTFENKSDGLALIALQGPNATDALSPLTSVNPEDLAYYTFISAEILGVKCIVSATGYTGAGGYELYIPVEHSGMVWSKLLETFLIIE